MDKKNPEKILFLSPVGHFKGGAEKCLIDFLENPEIDPFLVAPEDGAVLEYGRQHNIPVYVLPFGDINNIHRPFTFSKGIKAVWSLFNAAWNLNKIARKTGCRIVHSNGLKAHVINCVCGVLPGCRSVVHIHDIPYTRQEKLVWRIMYALCGAMVMVSRPCWPGKTLPKRCHVIHNGIVLPETAIETKKETEQENEITIGFVGRIHPAKGLHLLLEWVAFAHNAGLPVRLSIRGGFSEDAPEYEKEINDLISTLNIGPIVDFLGHISNPDDIYKDLDVVVVPSQKPDPLPRSVMEPMALGIPVFGYPAGGIGEMIEDGKTGFLVDDSNRFKKALEKVISNPQDRENIIAQAREKMAKEFSMEGLYTKLCDIYHQVL